MPQSDIPIANVVAVDIGCVCVTLQTDACARKLGFESVDDVKKNCPEILDYAYQLETGKLHPDEFIDNLIRATENQLTAEKIRDAWNTVLGDEIEGMAGIVDELLQMNLRLVLFSNISSIHFDYFKETVSFSSCFEGAVLSYEVGDAKPNPPMYEVMESKYCNGGVPILYLDDMQENIETALCRNWNAYQVGSIEGIKESILQAVNFSQIEDDIRPAIAGQAPKT